jgi:hypothetical protein
MENTIAWKKLILVAISATAIAAYIVPTSGWVDFNSAAGEGNGHNGGDDCENNAEVSQSQSNVQFNVQGQSVSGSNNIVDQTAENNNEQDSDISQSCYEGGDSKNDALVEQEQFNTQANFQSQTVNGDGNDVSQSGVNNNEQTSDIVQGGDGDGNSENNAEVSQAQENFQLNDQEQTVNGDDNDVSQSAENNNEQDSDISQGGDGDGDSENNAEVDQEQSNDQENFQDQEVNGDGNTVSQSASNNNEQTSDVNQGDEEED